MRFLVDANVLSEATRLRPNRRVIEWLQENSRHAVVNPIILGEIEFGILVLAHGRRRRRLLEWFSEAIQAFPMLDIDASTAAEWAKLLADLRRKGQAMPIKDSLIAASARQHGLIVATRNTADYRQAGVKLINPFGD